MHRNGGKKSIFFSCWSSVKSKWLQQSRRIFSQATHVNNEGNREQMYHKYKNLNE